MRNLVDTALATRRQATNAGLWASYAIAHYGDDAVVRLEQGFREPTTAASRRVLRMAIRLAEKRLHRKICIMTMPPEPRAAR